MGYGSTFISTDKGDSVRVEVCPECGAIVAPQQRGKHTRFHEQYPVKRCEPS